MGAPFLGALRGRQAHWWGVRELVRQGSLGRVAFCRVSHRSMAEAVDLLRFLFDGAVPISRSAETLRYAAFVAGYEKSDGYRLAICGTEATLVVDTRGYRRFA